LICTFRRVELTGQAAAASLATMEEGSHAGHQAAAASGILILLHLRLTVLSPILVVPDHEHGDFLCPDLDRSSLLLLDHERSGGRLGSRASILISSIWL
jgi:hypothetical protein